MELGKLLRRAGICLKPIPMRISTSLSWVCAATLVLGGLTAWADPDTEAQAKAREALRKALQQPSPAPLAPTPAAPAPAAPVSPAAPIAPGAPAPVVPAAAAAPVSPAAPESGSYGTIVMPPRADPETIEKAREAMRQKMQETAVAEAEAAKAVNATKPVAEAEPKSAKPKAKVETKSPASELKPLEGPASPLPASKEAQLAELLQLYKAEKVTPQEYHTQRAKILSGP